MAALKTLPQAFREVNAYYGNHFNSAITARLVLHLREASRHGDFIEYRNNCWEIRVLSEDADDLDDSGYQMPKHSGLSSHAAKYRLSCD